MLPNITVIIPAYNAEKYIKTSVCSVLNQPYKNINILIINDGSIDSTGTICDELAKSYSRVRVIHQKNCGVSVARNVGLKKIISDEMNKGYVIFLDADDFWFDNAITNEVVEKFRDTDVIGLSTYQSDIEGTAFKCACIYEDRDLVYNQCGNVDWFFGGTFAAHFIKTDLIQKNSIKFMENLKYNEDVIFIREILLCAQRVKFLSIPLYVYRNNNTSATHQNKINPNNATDIAIGWVKAKSFADVAFELTDSAKADWQKSCEVTAGARLLEAAMVLAKNGYSGKQIKAAIFNNELSYCYNLLREQDLCDWQKKPFRLLNNNLNGFVAYYHLCGMVENLARMILKSKPLIKFIMRKRYPLTKNDVLNTHCK